MKCEVLFALGVENSKRTTSRKSRKFHCVCWIVPFDLIELWQRMAHHWFIAFVGGSKLWLFSNFSFGKWDANRKYFFGEKQEVSINYSLMEQKCLKSIIQIGSSSIFVFLLKEIRNELILWGRARDKKIAQKMEERERKGGLLRNEKVSF